MKSAKNVKRKKAGKLWASVAGLGMAASSLHAADTNAPAAAAPPPLTPQEMFEGGTTAYTNWIDFSAGGFIIGGSKAQFQRQNQMSGGAMGGISDFHYRQDMTNNTSMVIDGRALLDEHDYKLNLGLQRDKVGYLRFLLKEYRTWYDGDGGYFPLSGRYYPSSQNPMALDRGEIGFEAGYTPDKGPQVVFKYLHTTRDGAKDSTSWGPTHQPGITLSRGLSPSFYDIDEHSDSFQLDVTDHIKSTDLGLGLRYETGRLNDALKNDQYPTEAFEQKTTDRQYTSYDLFSFHTSTETWLKKYLMVSSGFAYSDLDNNFSGSRIYGSDYDVGYSPALNNGFGYYGMTGSSRLHEYVGDLNVFYKPTPNVTIVPSLRVQQEDWNADSAGQETLGALPPTPFNANSARGTRDVSERLDLTYTGVTNWVLYARQDLTDGDGNLRQGGTPYNGTGPLPAGLQNETEDRRFLQKYSAGARWYPASRVAVDVGGYYKNNDYRYDNSVDSTPNNGANVNRYPGYLVMQNFETYDGNLRLTLRPRQDVSLISRYEFQRSTIQTQPDPISGLSGLESSKMTSHIIAQDATWVPWSRLSFQAGLSYVLSETRTPASAVTQAILASENNYWTVNATSTLVVDNKTDLTLSYFYYQADNFVNNSTAGVPYGSGADEHSITATLTRRISKNLSLSLKYGYFCYNDGAFGGNRDFNAHLVYSTLRYRF